MLGAVFWAMVALVGVAGTWVSVQSVRFRERVAGEARGLLARGTTPELELERLAELPAPVRRYLALALGDPPRAVRSVRFEHGGRFRPKLDGPWRPIRGQQYYTLDPPGFLWWGRLPAAPGVWIDARDRGVEGKGNMLVSLESSFTLFERSGPALDQGAMLRLLSELVWLPGALLDARYVSWWAVDDQHALATLSVGGVSVKGTFEFGPEDMPRSFRSERYLDSGSGQPRLLPWSGDYDDYRRVDGLLVPHHIVGYWHVDGERIPYVDFQVETLEYDVAQPF